MKWFKKLNRGAILTGLLLLGVVVYLVALSAGQRAQLPAVKQVVADYVQAELDWQMLPPAYRTDSPDMPAQELAAFIQRQAAVIRSHYIDNDAIVKPRVRLMTEGLQAQAAGRDVVFDYRKTITGFEDVVFDGSQVTVSFRSLTTLDGAGMAGGITEETSDQVILLKTGDRWRVVYAALNKPYNAQQDLYPDGKFPSVVSK